MKLTAIMMMKQIQYVCTLYLLAKSLSCVEKYPVMMDTGMNRIVTLARRMVMRVRRSTA